MPPTVASPTPFAACGLTPRRLPAPPNMPADGITSAPPAASRRSRANQLATQARPRPTERRMDDEAKSSAATIVERAPVDGARHDQSASDGLGERIDLPITGMTCAACANRIERSLNKAPGVRTAGVNYATGRATVEYDPSATDLRQLMDR